MGGGMGEQVMESGRFLCEVTRKCQCQPLTPPPPQCGKVTKSQGIIVARVPLAKYEATRFCILSISFSSSC